MRHWELHDQAMDAFEQSLVERFWGNEAKRQELLRRAYDKERQAVMLIVDRPECEERPECELMRIRHLASCTAMALNLGWFEEAQELIDIIHSLSPAYPGDTEPAFYGEVKDEIREYQEKINKREPY